ncbi:MAG: trimeric intracellular cation channel family protein, partial [Sphingobacterium siyangense]
IDLPPLACVLLGTVTACFGGVIRDILCNDVPVIFKKEIYATPCILGGVVFFVSHKYMLLESMISIATILSIIVIRLFAVRFHWSLPQPKI